MVKNCFCMHGIFWIGCSHSTVPDNLKIWLPSYVCLPVTIYESQCTKKGQWTFLCQSAEKPMQRKFRPASRFVSFYCAFQLKSFFRFSEYGTSEDSGWYQIDHKVSDSFGITQNLKRSPTYSTNQSRIGKFFMKQL